MKKNIVSKVIGVAGYMAANFGLMAGITKALGAFYQKHEISEDFVTNHPVLAFSRVILRIFVLTAAVGVICIVPFEFVYDKIIDFCDEHFSDDETEKEDEWE